jgi:hypothetical protein
MSSIISQFSTLLTSNPPYGLYNPINWDGSKLIDNINNNNALSVNAANLKLNEGPGLKPTTIIPYISGAKSSGLFWPRGSLGDKFTICSVSRYSLNSPVSNRKSIIHDATGTLYHGHYDGKAGYAQYGIAKVIANSGTDSNAWVVCCAKTSTKDDLPSNVFINGKSSGVAISTGIQGNGSNYLVINNNNSADLNSDFDLAYLIIWNKELTADELKIVSDALINYMNTGEIGYYSTQLPIKEGMENYQDHLLLDRSMLPAILEKQEFVNQAIMDENQRATDKFNSVQYALSGQQRDVVLNESYRQKYMAYTNLLIAFVVSIIAYLALVNIRPFAFGILGFILMGLATLLLFFCILYILFIIYTINSRDPVDFNKVKLDPPMMTGLSTGSGVVIKPYVPSNCANGDCCNVGTIWDPTLGKCEDATNLL